MSRQIRVRKRMLIIGTVLTLIAAFLLPGGAIIAQGSEPGIEPPEPDSTPPEAPDERETEEKAVKRWTVMVYMAADNNLESAAIDDFLEMASVGSTGYMNIVVQLDRYTGCDTTYGNWTNTRRFYITTGMTPTTANGISIGEQNMGSAVTLRGFINWAKTNYPAQKYALVLWNHGSGFQPANDDISSAGVAWDWASSNDYLTNKELSVVLNQVTNNGASKLDLVGFDAYHMAQMEVHQHIKNYAKFGVGSERPESNTGWPYDTILKWLKNNTLADGMALANKIADQYWVSNSYGETQSAVRYDSYYNTVTSRLNTFSDQLIAMMNANPANRAKIKNALAASIKLDSAGNFVDLYDFAHKIQTRSTAGSAIYSAASNLKSAVSNFVTRNRVGMAYRNAKGVTIFFPKDQATWNSWKTSYQTNQWLPRFTKWDEFLQVYFNGVFLIELTWNNTVHNLNSYLYLPCATPYIVSPWNPGSLSAFPYATVVDATKPGPEFTTISKFKPGTYMFIVDKIYLEPITLKNSGAIVKVYRNGILALTVQVSSASSDPNGTFWSVFSYHPATNTYTTINSLSSSYPGPY